MVGVPMAEADLMHLRRCVELASEAVDAGDFPFGSVRPRSGAGEKPTSFS